MIKTSNRRSAMKHKLSLTLALSGLLTVCVGSTVFADKPEDVGSSSKVAESKKSGSDAKVSDHVEGKLSGGKSSEPQSSSSEVKATDSKSSEVTSPAADSVTQTESSSTAASAAASSSDVAGDTVAGVAEKKARAEAILSNQATEHYELGQHYMHKFDWEMSEVELEAAIMCSPTMKAAHRDYCVVSLFRGQPMRSLAEFMMVVGLGDPIPLNDQEKAALIKKAARLHYQKGINYGVLHEWKKATPEFIAALSYAPNSAAIAHSLAFSYAADGNFERAEAEYLKAFALDPTNSYSHADFAMMLSEHGDHKKAMDELAKAIALSPSVAALHVDMAWLAESNGDFKTAETQFHEAVQLSPKHAGLWSHLGRVEERLGNDKDAKSAYNEALALDPGDDEAKTRLNALNKSSTPTSGEKSRAVNPVPGKKSS